MRSICCRLRRSRSRLERRAPAAWAKRSNWWNQRWLFEIGITNREIRAGKPRDEALRNLGERSGVDDIKSLVAMLIQTDRFGTSSPILCVSSPIRCASNGGSAPKSR